MAEQAKSIGELLRALDEQGAEEADDGLQEGQEEEQVAAPEPAPEGEEAKAKEPEPAPEVEEEAKTLEVENLHDLAEHLGVEVADLYKLKVPLSDGEALTLGEWKDRVQDLRRAETARKEASEARKRLQDEEVAFRANWQERIATVEALAKEEEARLTRAFQDTRWDELRATDPAEYAARRQELNEQYARLEGLRAKTRESVRQYQDEQASKQQEWLKATLQREQEALLNALPDWRDPEKAKAGKAQLIEYLASAGFGEQEIANLVDHRAVVLARKAMLYEEIQRAKPKAQTKVQAKIGTKVLSPSARVTPDQSKDIEKRDAMERLKKTGDRKDFGKLLRILGV